MELLLIKTTCRSKTTRVSDVIEQGVIDYANSIIKTWVPSELLVMDITLSEDGSKVIEFNNINSSGFCASNVLRYVEAVQVTYAHYFGETNDFHSRQEDANDDYSANALLSCSVCVLCQE